MRRNMRFASALLPLGPTGGSWNGWTNRSWCIPPIRARVETKRPATLRMGPSIARCRTKRNSSRLPRELDTHHLEFLPALGLRAEHVEGLGVRPSRRFDLPEDGGLFGDGAVEGVIESEGFRVGG